VNSKNISNCTAETMDELIDVYSYKVLENSTKNGNLQNTIFSLQKLHHIEKSEEIAVLSALPFWILDYFSEEKLQELFSDL
jgi:hypothetical protein